MLLGQRRMKSFLPGSPVSFPPGSTLVATSWPNFGEQNEETRNPAVYLTVGYRTEMQSENVMATKTTTQGTTQGKPQGKTLDQRETASLIGSDKVEGTPVYRSNGERVGRIEIGGASC